MGSDWKSLRLGELGTFKNGVNYSQKDIGSKYPIATVKNLFRGRYVTTNDLDAIKDGVIGKIDDYLLYYGDLIFARSSVKREGSGQVAIFNEGPDNCVFSGFTIRFRVHDPDEAFPLFLLYLFRSPQYREEFTRIATGTTIHNLSQSALASIDMRLPPIDVQKSVAHILGTLDDKIELNRQMNATLETMAQVLFKSWFVDFDPVIDNALAAGNPIPEPLQARAETRKALGDKRKPLPDEIHKQFPGSFAFSEEMGWMPEGWEVSTFGKISKCFDSKRIPLSKKQREEKQPGSIPYYGATSVMDYVNEWIFDDIYLLIGEDGSVIKEDGTPFVQYIWGKTWVNNHAHVLQGDADISTEQLMLFMSQQNMSAYVTGAVQLKINQKNMNSIPFLKAPASLNVAFSGLVAPYYARIRQTTEETRSLEIIRDTLLPKLLSGQLRIPDAEKQLAEAI